MNYATFSLCAPRCYQALLITLLIGWGAYQQPPTTQPRSADDLAKLVDEHFARREAEGFSGVILLAVDGHCVGEGLWLP